MQKSKRFSLRSQRRVPCCQCSGLTSIFALCFKATSAYLRLDKMAGKPLYLCSIESAIIWVPFNVNCVMSVFEFCFVVCWQGGNVPLAAFCLSGYSKADEWAWVSTVGGETLGHDQMYQIVTVPPSISPFEIEWYTSRTPMKPHELTSLSVAIGDLWLMQIARSFLSLRLNHACS